MYIYIHLFIYIDTYITQHLLNLYNIALYCSVYSFVGIVFIHKRLKKYISNRSLTLT